MSKVIGIDLGTTNSCLAILEHGSANIISSAEGGRTTPSVVSFGEKEIIVGIAARRQAILNALGTITSVKRFMGRTLEEVTDESQSVPYELASTDSGAVRVKVRDEEKSPEEISALILKKLKEDAESYSGEEIDQAVITVPAYFNDAQRQATKQAAEIAGLEVLRLVNEPTAAALAYGFGDDKDERLLVFDMGGGTLDVSVLELGDNVWEVLSTSGDNHLGGVDFDKCIVDWMISEFKEEYSQDLSDNPDALQRLYDAGEKAKIELSNLPETRLHLPFIAAVDGSPVHFDRMLGKEKLEELTHKLIERAMKPLEICIQDCMDKAGPVDQVILVGGMTRMPAIHELASKMTRVEPRRGVNPDEAVALGAAIQAGVLVGEVEDVLLLDVIPLSLGIGTKGDIMRILIEANTTIPIRMTETFTTAEDNQKSVEVRILQGERTMVDDNTTLGRIQLLGIPPAKSGVPQIEVVFDVNTDGILNVSALDLGTGAHQELEITSATGLESSEVERLRLEAVSNKEEDLKAKTEATSVVRATSIRNQAKQLISEKGEEMTDQELSDLQKGMEDISQYLTDGTDINKIRAAANLAAANIQAFQTRLYGNIEEADFSDFSTLESIEEAFVIDDGMTEADTDSSVEEKSDSSVDEPSSDK